MSIKADGKVRVLTITKSRDGETGKPYAFQLGVIKLGIDEDLVPITSCVALPADINDAKSLQPKPSGQWQALVIDMFQELGSKYTIVELLQLIQGTNPIQRRWRESTRKAISDLLKKGVLKKEGSTLSIA